MNTLTSTGPYVPRSNAGFATWLRAMSQGLARDPAMYGITAVEAEFLVAEAEKFFAADAVTQIEITRNKVTIRERDEIRNAITPLFRRYAQRIKLNDGVGDPEKINIGVRPRHRGQQRRFVPESLPMLGMHAATNGQHVLTSRDSNTPNSRAKPFSAVSLQVFCAITDGSAEATIDEARFCGSYTRNQFTISHPFKEARRTATYWARWQGRRGDFGPWSLPVSFTIAFGGTGSKIAGREMTVMREAETAADQTFRMAA